jgi:hypothetical protein
MHLREAWRLIAPPKLQDTLVASVQNPGENHE